MKMTKASLGQQELINLLFFLGLILFGLLGFLLDGLFFTHGAVLLSIVSGN